MQRLSDRSLQVLNGLLNHLDRVGQFTDVLHNDSQPTIKVSEAAQALAELLRLYDEKPSEPNQNYSVMPRLPYSDKPPQHLMGTQKLTTVSDDVARIAKLEKGLSELALVVNRLMAETEKLEGTHAIAMKDATEANRVAYEAKAIAHRSESIASDRNRVIMEMLDGLKKVLTK